MSAPLIDSLIGPMGSDHFFEDRFEKFWSLSERREGQRLPVSFTLDDVERYLTIVRPWEISSGRSLVVAKPGDFSCPPPTNVSEALSYFARGYSLVLNEVQAQWPSLAATCAELSAAFLCRVTANVYCTPAGSVAFPEHYDGHDVFIVQTVGTKRWWVRAMNPQLPLNSLALLQAVPAGPPEPEETLLLQTGDVLYLPRGCAHRAAALGDASVHVTLAVHPLTFRDVLRAVLKEAAKLEPEFYSPLSMGECRTVREEDTHARAVELMEKASRGLDFAELTRRLRVGLGVDSGGVSSSMVSS